MTPRPRVDQSRRLFLLAISSILAAFLSICIIGSLSSPVEAQTATVPDTVPQEWVDQYRKTVRATESPDPVKRSAARRILTRSIAKVGGSRFLGATTKLGLAGAAVGSWAVVGYELKYVSEFGTSESVATSVRVAPATGTYSAYGKTKDGARSGYIIMTRLQWKIGADGKRYYEVGTQRFVEKWYGYNDFGKWRWQGQSGSVGTTANTYTWTYDGYGQQDIPPPEPAPAYTFGNMNTSGMSATTAPQYVLATDYNSWVYGSPVNRQGPQLCSTSGCSFTKYFPSVQTGPSTLPESQTSPDYSTTPTEGNAVIQEVVTDPEAPTVVPDAPPDWETLPDPPADPQYDPEAPENDPDPDEPAWDPDPYGDPASPLYDPQNPEADPDEDGIPNKNDPDDDNDGIPDEQDPKPFVPGPYPAEHPQGDPDGDGIPNETDPDDDNDGIPDEADPNPHDPTNPDMKPDHPEADPDGDGIPNKNDPDDDNDGIPDSDDPNPYDPTNPDMKPDDPNADPDGDGIPNKDDPDDDNDGIPDEADPNPQTPDDPSTLPFWHPYADPDKDGTPNRKDRDDDEDKVPDWQEPEPWNPSSPADPAADEDKDGVPDWDDPWKGNKLAPHDPQKDTDSDNEPDYKDPDPEDPAVPHSPTGPSSTSYSEPPAAPSKPWSPSATWQTGNPGDPNVPKQPANPNMPQTQNTPQNPTDPSVPGQPYPTNPNETDDPTTETNPDDPGTPTQSGGCPVPPKNNFDKDSRLFPASIFPFNLFILAADAFNSLDAPPQTPQVGEVIPPDYGGKAVDLHQFDGIAAHIRRFNMVAGVFFVCLFMYKLISQSKEGD